MGYTTGQTICVQIAPEKGRKTNIDFKHSILRSKRLWSSIICLHPWSQKRSQSAFFGTLRAQKIHMRNEKKTHMDFLNDNVQIWHDMPVWLGMPMLPWGNEDRHPHRDGSEGTKPLRSMHDDKHRFIITTIRCSHFMHQWESYRGQESLTTPQTTQSYLRCHGLPTTLPMTKRKTEQRTSW